MPVNSVVFALFGMDMGQDDTLEVTGSSPVSPIDVTHAERLCPFNVFLVPHLVKYR